MIYITPPVQPTGRVLVLRGFAITFTDKRKVFSYIIRGLCAGLVIGSLWHDIDEKEFQIKLNLFASTYLFVNLALVDLFDGLHRRLTMFLRERDSGSSSSLAYWLSDPAPSFILNAICCFLLAGPIYIISGLREGFWYFGYFYLLILASVYCNTGFAFLLSTYTKSALTSRLIFNGIIIPLQLLFSGFLFLLPSMGMWYSWISYLSPMSYYLAGLMANEYNGNDSALTSISYDQIQDIYGYHTEDYSALIVIAGIGFLYKLLWLYSLFSMESISKTQILRKDRGVRKKMSRKILSAGLRWRNRSAANPQSSQIAYQSPFVGSTDDYLGGLESDMFDQSYTYKESDRTWTNTLKNIFRKKSSAQNETKPKPSDRIVGLGSGSIHDNNQYNFGKKQPSLSIFSSDSALFDDDSSVYHEL